MKRIFNMLALVALLALTFGSPDHFRVHALAIPASQWTWVDGSKTAKQWGTYGTEDVPDAANVPGSRSYSVSWTDSAGNLWLFGGFGYDSAGSTSYLNDLWMFNPTSGQWAWADGSKTISQSGTYGSEDVPDAANVPGARSRSATWMDSSGNLWLFGGQGYDSAGSLGNLNDLWMFNPSTGQWTWVDGSKTISQSGTYGVEDMSDAANVPGARNSPVTWVDSADNLWFFGGFGNDSAGTEGRLNDLWKFNPATGQWTWVDGSNAVHQAGVYGTEDVPAPTNVPGARDDSVSWIDSAGNLWLFGGKGDDITGYTGFLNDLWKFNPATGQWTWVDGPSARNQLATYGTEDVSAAANVPGSRIKPVSWMDSAGNLWLFGGWGYTASSGGELNDLWKFNPASGQWTWVDGAKKIQQSGIYGTEDATAAANVPGGRYAPVSWIDNTGNLWLFGGFGYDSAGTSGSLNDLWMFGTVQATFRSQGANDGWVIESTETSGMGGMLDAAGSTFRIGDGISDKQYRAILSFNTSSLPDTAVITKVTLKIRQSGSPVGTNPFAILGGLRVDIRQPRFGSTAGLTNGDFQAAAGKNNIGTIGNAPVNGWYTKIWSTNTFFSHINLTGTTQFRLRFAKDDNDNGLADYLKFNSGNHATVSVRPTLIIEYYVP